MMMLQLTDACWVNPDAVIAVEHAFNMAVDDLVLVHLDTGSTVTVMGTSVPEVVARLQAFSHQQQAEFTETLEGSHQGFPTTVGDVRPFR